MVVHHWHMGSLTSSSISLVEYWLVTPITMWDMVLEPRSNLLHLTNRNHFWLLCSYEEPESECK